MRMGKKSGRQPPHPADRREIGSCVRIGQVFVCVGTPGREVPFHKDTGGRASNLGKSKKKMNADYNIQYPIYTFSCESISFV
mmetsp:Transcript_2325/g.5409  ORF Transcript_2325/g.5409 Transcript_2325/m.5409 type:complete len:82 (-) Transcript_2325:55-300(-)